jgi:CO/xanthine dehydrogenase FAD-binding subunit
MIKKITTASTLEDALASVQEGASILSGGTFLSKNQEEIESVVDISHIPLSGIQITDRNIEIGANTKLQELVLHPDIPKTLKEIIKREKSLNIRNAATIAGTLLTSKGESGIKSWFIGAQAVFSLYPKDSEQRVANDRVKDTIITSIQFDKRTNVVYQTVSRTPDDVIWVGVFLNAICKPEYQIVLCGFSTNVLELKIDVSKQDPQKAVEELLINSRSQYNNKFCSFNYFLKTSTILLLRLLDHTERSNDQ